MRRLLLVAFVLGTFGMLPTLAEPVSLFNGRDLSGWVFDVKGEADPESIWSVRDGLLICRGTPPGVIRTTQDYGDYELTLEWRWAPGTRGGNSGLLLHCSKPRELGIWPRSIEVQLGSGNAGDFWMIGETLEVSADRKPATGRRIPNLTKDSENAVGEWNTLRVRCQDRRIAVWVNDDMVNAGSHCSTSRGAISLQSEGGEIHVRKLVLHPLD